MGTISRGIAVDVINGKYDDDKPVKIVTYLNAWDSYTLAVVFAHENYNKYEQSPACREVDTLFKGGMLTAYGAGYFIDEVKNGSISLDLVPDGVKANKWYSDAVAKAQQNNKGEQS